MPISPSFASRVLMAIGSVQAMLALGLPFALESGSAGDANDERLFGGTQVWSGWSLATASQHNGRSPVPKAAAFALVIATACLVVLAWLALERSRTWMLALAASVGGALLFGSVLIGNSVQSTFRDEPERTSGWGLPVWRVALLLLVVAALRAVAQEETEAAARWS